MSATIITEYKSYGGNSTHGDLPQVPGEVVRFAEYDSSTGRNHIFHESTQFFSIISDAAQHYNFKTTDSAGDTLLTGARGRIPSDQVFYQAVTNNQGERVYTQVNIKNA